jgi:hypothetical protein
LAASRRDVEDRVKHLAQIRRPGPTGPSDDWPVVSLAYLPPLRSYRRRVNSVQAIGISVQCCHRIEAQPTEFTQPVSDRTLRFNLAAQSVHQI